MTKNDLSIFLSKQAELHSTDVEKRLNKIATNLLTAENVKEYLNQQIQNEIPLLSAWFCLNDLLRFVRSEGERT